jgi:hypothetical protein
MKCNACIFKNNKVKRCRRPAVHFYHGQSGTALCFGRCKQHRIHSARDFIILSEDEYVAFEIMES